MAGSVMPEAAGAALNHGERLMDDFVVFAQNQWIAREAQISFDNSCSDLDETIYRVLDGITPYVSPVSLPVEQLEEVASKAIDRHLGQRLLALSAESLAESRRKLMAGIDNLYQRRVEVRAVTPGDRPIEQVRAGEHRRDLSVVVGRINSIWPEENVLSLYGIIRISRQTSYLTEYYARILEPTHFKPRISIALKD